MGGYLTDSSKPDLTRVEHFIQAVGSFEDKIFMKRAQLHQRQAQRMKRQREQAKRGDDVDPRVRNDAIVPVARFEGSRLASGAAPAPFQQNRSQGGSSHPAKLARISSMGSSVAAAIVEAEDSLENEQENKEELKTKLKEALKEKSDLFNCENPEEDKVKLGEPGWKDRYYQEKFGARNAYEIESIRRDVVQKYAEGLCWVMHYYYEGVCSWQWFYPYHYAPFASDLTGLVQLDIKFELGTPFKPFDQLMGVFPAASSHALPEHYRKLMMDPSSPIIDFYPTDFEVDMNGKRYSWQGIAKLPFIDEERLLAEIKKVEHTLTDEEARRNSILFDMLFVNGSHPLSPYIFSMHNSHGHLPIKERVQIKEKIDPQASGGMNGYLSLCNGDPSPLVFSSPVDGMQAITDNRVICAIYKLPDPHKHITRPPPDVIIPKKIVESTDLKPPPVLWHEDNGRRRHEDSGRRWHEDNGRRPLPQIERHNPPGAISGRQLGDAAHRLVINSLHGPCNPYDATMSPSGVLPYPGSRHQSSVDHRYSQQRPDEAHYYSHNRDYRDRRDLVPHGHSNVYSSSSSSRYQDRSQYGTQPGNNYYANGGSHHYTNTTQPAAPYQTVYDYRAPYGGNYSEQQDYRDHHHNYGGRGSYGRGQGQRPQHNNYNNNRYGALDRRHQPAPPGYGQR